MGRTFEALSQGRGKRDTEEEKLPATIVHPDIPLIEECIEAPTPISDTPISGFEGLPGDNDQVPFIEVGAMSVDSTPRPSIALLMPPKLKTPVAPSEHDLSIPTVHYFPIPDQARGVGLPNRVVARELVTYHRPDHAISLQYRSLLDGILKPFPDHHLVLICTPVTQPEESARVVLNLAITRAKEEGKRVLVVEANHEHPFIAEQLGIASLPGLREVLDRRLPLNLVLHRTAQTGLYALPLGDPNLPVSSNAEARLPHLMEQLRLRFDCVFVSAPTWAEGNLDGWIPLGDGTYLVVQQDQWDSAEVEAAHAGIAETGGTLRGYITLGR